MSDNDYKKQIKEWRKKNESIPDLMGGKQLWFLLVKEIVNYVSKNQPCSLDDIPNCKGIPELQPLRVYLPFLKGVDLLQKESDALILTETGTKFQNNPSKNFLANLIQNKYRWFGEVLDLLAEKPLTVAEVNSTICNKYELNWTNLSKTRKRMDWLEVLDLIYPLGSNKWEASPIGREALSNWCIVFPEAIEFIYSDSSSNIIIQKAPEEITTLLQRLIDNPDLHKKRNTYNIWVPKPNQTKRIDNLRNIIQFCTERISKKELFDYIMEEFSISTGSVESILPFLKASGLIEEVGRGVYIATIAAKAWLETGNDLDFIRVLHSNMRFVGEMIKASEKDIIRNDMYEKAKHFGINTEKARWIAGLLLEADLLEEPQYLHLKATPLGKAFVNELPLADENTYKASSPAKEKEGNTEEKKTDTLNKTIELLQKASVDPMAEAKASGVAFEEETAAVFRLMGFEAEKIGGSGDTDVVISWKDDKGKKHTAIIDAKSKSSGKVAHSDISDVAIETHKEKHSAEFVAIVGRAFSGDTIRNHARKKGFALISTDDIANIARSSVAFGLSLQEIALLFQVPNGLSQLSEIISEKQRKSDIISVVVQKMLTKQEEFDGLSPRDMHLLLEDNAISPSLEELLAVFELLSKSEIGVLVAENRKPNPEITKNTICNIFEGKQKVFRLRALANAIENGLEE